MTINGITENQIVNHNTVNGYTNREMYNISRKGNFEMYWFSFDGENDFKSTSFAKAKNYTVAHLDNWGSGEIDNYVKIDNTWYYVTKEQLTNLFDPNYEGTDEEIDNYVEDNVTIEEETDPDVLMRTRIIFFLKGDIERRDMTLQNDANGVKITLIKDGEFFDVSVSNGEESYSNSFSMDIEDFTELFDFIYDSIDKCAKEEEGVEMTGEEIVALMASDRSIAEDMTFRASMTNSFSNLCDAVREGLDYIYYRQNGEYMEEKYSDAAPFVFIAKLVTERDSDYDRVIAKVPPRVKEAIPHTEEIIKDIMCYINR